MLLIFIHAIVLFDRANFIPSVQL